MLHYGSIAYCCTLGSVIWLGIARVCRYILARENTTQRSNAYQYYATNSAMIDSLYTSQHRAIAKQHDSMFTGKNGKTSSLVSCPRHQHVTSA